MKVEIENLKGHFKKITIEVPAEKVVAHSDDYYKKLQRDVELKGFRKGKAPLTLVRDVYKDSAQARISRELVENHFGEAVREHKLAPVSPPDINVENFSELSGLKFTATFENTPPVELKNYTSFKADKSEVTISPEELNTTLNNIRGQMASFEELPEGTLVVADSVVELDYDAKENGEAFAPASDKDASFELGNGTLVPDFEKNILGMKKGDVRTFSVKFPEATDPAEKTPVSGRTLEFTVTVKGIKKKIMPELNDEFAKKLGPFENLEALKSRIEADIKNEKQGRQRRDQLEKAVTWLIEQNPVETSETMVNQQIEQLAVEAGMQLQQMGLNEQQIEERLKGWGDEMGERAVRQVKASLLLSTIAEKENIKASDDDLRQEITRMAQQTRKNPQDVWQDLQQRGLVYGLVRQITELKALDWVVEKAS